MTDELTSNIRASRMHVARSRGAVGGVVLVILGLWAALVPFIGTYLDLKTTPHPDAGWTWTAARGWLEVLPGAVAVVGGLILLLSSHRVITSFGGWLAAAAGAWLVIGPALASVLHLSAPAPDPAASQRTQSLTMLLTFSAIGAAIVLFAALALGRLSVHGIGDVRAAGRRAERAAEADKREAERAEAERVAEAQRLAAERHRHAQEQDVAEQPIRHAGASADTAEDEFADYRTDGRSIQTTADAHGETHQAAHHQAQHSE